MCNDANKTDATPWCLIFYKSHSIEITYDNIIILKLR